jgi:glucan endo-1,3-alpha-glucosidase
VLQYLDQYSSNSFYFRFNGLPFVTTFEGVANANDWAQGGPIRSAIGGVYFVPTWTSIGTGGVGSVLGDIDGFSSWDM